MAHLFGLCPRDCWTKSVLSFSFNPSVCWILAQALLNSCGYHRSWIILVSWTRYVPIPLSNFNTEFIDYIDMEIEMDQTSNRNKFKAWTIPIKCVRIVKQISSIFPNKHTVNFPRVSESFQLSPHYLVWSRDFTLEFLWIELMRKSPF